MKKVNSRFFAATRLCTKLVLIAMLFAQTPQRARPAQAAITQVESLGKLVSQGDIPIQPQYAGARIVAPNAMVAQVGPQQYRASVSIAPRFYQDDRGQWQLIDTRLQAAQTNGRAEFVSDKGIAQVWLPQRLGDGAIRLRGTTYFAPERLPPAAAVQVNTLDLSIQPDPQEVNTNNTTTERLQESPASVDSDSSKVVKNPPPVSVSDMPLIVQSGEISWLPLELEVVDGAGIRQTLGAPASVPGMVYSNTLTYVDVWPGVNEQFVAEPTGLKHTLILNSAAALPTGNPGDDAYLMYRGVMTFSTSLRLYADGAEQGGDFSTSGAIELRDGAGRAVLTLPPVIAFDQTQATSRSHVNGRYVVQQAGDQATLAFGVPLRWLRDPARQFPVVIDPTVAVWPPLADTDISRAYPMFNVGSDTTLWVSESNRGLVRWDVSTLQVPAAAMIDSATAFLFQNQSTGVPTATVGMHAATNQWNEYETTWLSRTTSALWGSPGGEFLQSPEASAEVGTVSQWYSWNLTDLNAEWHSGNRPNFGVLVSATLPSSGTFNHIFRTRESSVGGGFPELDITYTLGPVATAAYTPVQRGVPSPDLYSFSPVSGWNGFAVRPPANSDYDLDLFSSSVFTSNLISSGYGGDSVDYVLVDRNHAPAQNYFPRIRQYSLGRGQYAAEFAPSTSLLTPGTHGPFTMGVNEMMRVWDIDLAAGQTYTIVVQPLADDLDVSVALHKSEPLTSTTWYQSRDGAVTSSDTSGPARQAGRTEFLRYTAPTSDRYGLVVHSRGGHLTSRQYRILIDSTQPAGGFDINGNAVFANNANVTLGANAGDAQTGISHMRYSVAPLDRVLVLQDEDPWLSIAVLDELNRNGIPYDVAGSSVITTAALGAYALVVVPSVQPDAFCTVFNNNLSRFEGYVQNGGALQVHTGRYISQTCRYNLPNGVSSQASYPDTNSVALASHPLAAGLSSLIYGNSPSLSYFINLPPGATTIVTEGSTGSGQPTLIDYAYGSGRVVASGMAQEFYFFTDFGRGLSYYRLLQNMLRYAYGMVAYNPTHNRTLTGADGVKTIYGWFQNGAGLWTAAQQDSIVLDTVAPSSTASSTSLTSVSPITVSWSASDALAFISQVQLWVRVGDGLWVNTGSAQVGSSGTFNYTPVNGYGVYYFATVAVDTAGNAELPPSDAGDTATRYVSAGGKIFVPIGMNNYVDYFLGPNEREDNDSASQANGPLAPGRTYTGFFNDVYDVYRIDLPAAGSLNVILTPPASMLGRIQLQVSYQTAANQLPGSPIVSAPYTFSRAGLPAGRYYIIVYTDPTRINPAATYQLTVTYP